MAILSSNRIAWTYTDDQGNNWRVAAQKALTDQGVLGGAPALESVPERPNLGKMRRCTVSNPAGQSRVVPVYQVGAAIVAPGTAINVNFLQNSTPMTSNGGFIAEERPRRNVIKQST